MSHSLSLGFTLFEVLISLAILTLVLLGLDAMELSALRLSMRAYYSSLAEQQVQNMEERLRVFSASEELNQVVEAWKQENKRILPEGGGSVDGSYPSYTIRVFWGKKQNQSCGTILGGAVGCVSTFFTL